MGGGGVESEKCNVVTTFVLDDFRLFVLLVVFRYCRHRHHVNNSVVIQSDSSYSEAKSIPSEASARRDCSVDILLQSAPRSHFNH